jgi:hypothetical protein
MHVCYIDEAGDAAPFPHVRTLQSGTQPVFILLGVFVPRSSLQELTSDLINLKQSFFPGINKSSANFLDWLLTEVKGADVRRSIREGGRNKRRAAFRVLDQLFEITETNNIQIAGRIFIKPLGGRFDGRAVYTSSVQIIARTFQAYLSERRSFGQMICDSRDKCSNTQVAHSLLTQMHRAGTNPLDRFLDVPTYGHSNNHAGLQLADLLVSAVLAPLAMQIYCAASLAGSTLLSPEYLKLRDRYGARLRKLQYRYRDAGNNGNWTGGLSLSNPGGRGLVTDIFA